jgi:hypothetical protein
LVRGPASYRAANECEPFRYRLADGHDRIHIGTTTPLEWDLLAFVYYDCHEDFASFCDGAVRAHVGQYFERLQRHLSDPGPALRRSGSLAGNDRR